MNYNVLVEGQNIPVPEDIGASDEAVKNALSPFYPEVANAMITRVEKDGTTTINVVKRAGSKGLENLAGLDYLINCPGGKNQAVALYEELQVQDESGYEPYELLRLDARIEGAIKLGQEEAQKVEYALTRLKKSAPRPAPFVIQGF